MTIRLIICKRNTLSLKVNSWTTAIRIVVSSFLFTIQILSLAVNYIFFIASFVFSGNFDNWKFFASWSRTNLKRTISLVWHTLLTDFAALLSKIFIRNVNNIACLINPYSTSVLKKQLPFDHFMTTLFFPFLYKKSDGIFQLLSTLFELRRPINCQTFHWRRCVNTDSHADANNSFFEIRGNSSVIFGPCLSLNFICLLSYT